MEALKMLARGMMMTFSLVYLIEISGAMQKLNRAVFKVLYGAKMPYNGWYIPLFGCAKCATFWTVLALGIVQLPFIYALGNACLCSFLAPIFSDAMKLLIRKALDGLNR